MAFSDMIGKQVPSVTFHTQQQGKWVDVSTDELFKGKKSYYSPYQGRLHQRVHHCIYPATMNWQLNLPN